MSISGPTILVVEDNDDDLFALKWSLGKGPFQLAVRHVPNGQQAVDYLSGVGSFSDRSAYPVPDLIFLDVKLPLVSGHEVLEWIGARPDLAGIPVVILSGSDEQKDHDRAVKGGARAYLVKPSTPKEIAEILRRFLHPDESTLEPANRVART